MFPHPSLRPLAGLPVVLAASAVPVAARPAGPLDLATRVLAETRVTAADGTTRIELAAPGRIVPGDAMVVRLDYRNTGAVPLADLVLANPLPAGLAYRGPAQGDPAPEVSADGHRFAPLAALTVARSGGGVRPAVAADVTHVRWRLARPLAPGAGGSLAFRAAVK